MCNSASTLRVLIADDEVPARRQLRRVLTGLPGIELVGEASNGLEALHLVEALRPDLLILDIQMPEMSGIDVAANLPLQHGPQVIFATAFDEHAVQAFELAAIDYLLKPWDTARLLLALDRARQRLGQPVAALPAGFSVARRILVRDSDGLRPIDCDGILCLRASDNHVILRTDSREWVLREPLSALLERLNHPDFLRVHRSHAVNLTHVREVLPLHKGDGDLILVDGYRVPYSRTCREALLQKLAGRAVPEHPAG